MPLTTRVRVRGIYSTAITALLLECGFAIADPSPTIRERFGLTLSEVMADVDFADRHERQGIVLEGIAGNVEEVADALQATLPHAAFRPYDDPSITRSAAPQPWGQILRIVQAQYRTEFPAQVKARLDEVRASVMPTVPGHHQLKLIDAGAVARAEAELARGAAPADALAQRLRSDLIYRHLRPGRPLTVHHVKAGGRTISMRGTVASFEARLLVMHRRFHAGGTYDDLEAPKRQGDWGTITMAEGDRVTRRRYLRADGTLLGEVYNVGTPVELYPDRARYLDLELDVVRFPDGRVRLVDEDELAEKAAQELLTPALVAEARRVAREVYEQLRAGHTPEVRPGCRSGGPAPR